MTCFHAAHYVYGPRDCPACNPTLSSEERAQQWSEANAQERKEQEEEEEKLTSEEAAYYRSLPCTPDMEQCPLPSFYQISNEESLAEVAAALRCIARREKTLHGFEPTTEIRIPMRLLLELVHGERNISRSHRPLGEPRWSQLG